MSDRESVSKLLEKAQEIKSKKGTFKLDEHPEIIQDIDEWLQALENGECRVGIRRFIDHVLKHRHKWTPARETLSNWLHARRAETWQKVKM